MSEATFYDLTTGEIVMVSDLTDEVEVIQNTPAGCGYVLGEYDPATQFVFPETGLVSPRPVVPFMVGSGYDLAQLPAGAVLVVVDGEGFSTEVPAQADSLELIEPGAYRVRSVSPFPWIDFAIGVTV